MKQNNSQQDNCLNPSIASKNSQRVDVDRVDGERNPTRNKTLPADKIKVVCVFGEFEKGKDFVLEPACPDDCDCELCQKAFYIQRVEDDK